MIYNNMRIIIIFIILFISLYYRRQCRDSDLNYISVSLNWNVTPGITTMSHNPELHVAHIDKRDLRNAIFLLHSLMCFRPKCHGAGESTAEIMAVMAEVLESKLFEPWVADNFLWAVGHPRYKRYKHLHQRDGDLTSHVSRDISQGTWA